MCKAFSAIVLESGEVLWKMGIDSHDDLLCEFGIMDKAEKPNFGRVEYVPENDNYINPNKWIFRLDEQIKPQWWKPIYESYVIEAWKEWKGKINKILIKKPIINPFKDVEPPKKIIKKHINLLKEWASVRASVRASVWASVGDSVGAYWGTFFKLPRKSWKHTEKILTQGYPFKPAVDLWEMGLVSSFDGKKWRLHGGPEAEILWEEK